MAKPMREIPSLATAPPDEAAVQFPQFGHIVRVFQAACNYIISQITLTDLQGTGKAPIYHAHVYIDRREYLVSFVPTDLDGPEAGQ